MGEPTKLARRMKKDNGQASPSSKFLGESKKRKSLSKPEDLQECFTGYGLATEQGDLQDENLKPRTTLANGNDNGKSTMEIETTTPLPPSKKHKPAPPATSELLKYFSKIQVNGQSNIKETIQVKERSNTKESVQVNERSSIKEFIQVKDSGSVKESIQVKVRGSIKESFQVKERGSTKKSVQVNEKISTTESVQINEGNSANETTQGNKRSNIKESIQVNKKCSAKENNIGGATTDAKMEAQRTLKALHDQVHNSKPKSESTILTDEMCAKPSTKGQKKEPVANGRHKHHGNISKFLHDISAEKAIDLRSKDSSEKSQSSVLVDESNVDNGPALHLRSKARSKPSPRSTAAKEKLGPKKSKSKSWKKNSAFSDSDRSESDYDNDDSEDSDFAADTEVGAKLDPSQRSILTMFSRRSSHLPSTLNRVTREKRPESSALGDSLIDSMDEEIDEEQDPNRKSITNAFSKMNHSRLVSTYKSVSGAERDRERDSNDSSDDDDDFMDAKVDEKQDPNQRSISTMFMKIHRPPASSYVSNRPERKRQLTQLSRSLLSGGLSNHSNTCYLNSVLQTLRNTAGCAQVLFAIQDKVRVLEEALGSQIKVTEYQRCLFDHALDVFRTLNAREMNEAGNDVDKKSIYPKEVISTLRHGDSLFNSSEQQDAAEFLFYVISQLEDVLKALLQLWQETRSQLAKDIESLISETWHPINDLFQVGIQTVTHCQKCQSVTINVDRGIDLTVQIDADNPALVRDLDWGITATMKMEHMRGDNQRFCDKCNSKEDAHVYHYFTSLPKVMILRLQRYNFKEDAMKLQNGVSCTEKMDFEKWMSQDYKGPDVNYELCAIIVHRGRVIASGHYYVYIKKDVEIETTIIEPEGESRVEKKVFRWLKYNDSSVDPVSDEDMDRVFSGQVSAQANSDIDSWSSGGARGLGSVNDGIAEASFASSTLLDDDLGTPYVYLYRRVDQAQ
ncbi:hypothetical protein EDD21DRAFT_383353 [Dissophora ornata]|nr:hypothetical protein EDD21DRAFT_383353 [Dissophora ornata]